jgi:hypothetical protein
LYRLAAGERRGTLALVKLFTATLIAWAAAGLVLAQPATNADGISVRYVIGLDNIPQDAKGKLTIQDGALRFKAGKSENKVPIASIDDIFIGTETTQSGGKAGRDVKIAAIAAPYYSGKLLTLFMRTKVDVLTVSFHDPEGGQHGAIFELPIGQATPMRAQMIQAGAHSSPEANQAGETSKP